MISGTKEKNQRPKQKGYILTIYWRSSSLIVAFIGRVMCLEYTLKIMEFQQARITYNEI